MTERSKPSNVLVMGVGNTLLQDDGIGVHVSECLRAGGMEGPGLRILDGGTIGLSLLPDIEDADAVIIVDASEIGEPPGTIRVFRDAEIDRLLSTKRRTVHEVALLDLFAAAAIRGRSPARRALVAVQPACTEWGLEPTPRVRAAIPDACEAVTRLTGDWRQETHHAP